jgi:GNAT superfamily N-acetyltransferase
MAKAKAKTPDPTTLKRESAGTYRTPDGRFTVQEASGRWMVLDAEEQDELGLPLTRGPYDTLAEAKGAIASARSGPAPTSSLEARLKAGPRDSRTPRAGGKAREGRGSPRGPSTAAPRPEPPPVEIRRYRSGDGEALRQLWQSIGLTSLGDDDESLDRMAERNPGLLLVATEGDAIVGSALGAWDGRRGWIYHVGTTAGHRREGLGGRLVHEVERKLRQLGCPKVNVVVRDENPEGASFWESLGYSSPPSRQFGKEL